MKKTRRWQFFLILSVITLTIYNILPTVFYYFKPLRSPVQRVEGEKIAKKISKRMEALEKDSIAWLHSFCKLIQVDPSSISLNEEHPEIISLRFQKTEDAARFKGQLPRSGSLIPFQPMQMTLHPQQPVGKEVLVQRKIPVRLSEDYFSFISFDSPDFEKLLKERAAQIAYALEEPPEISYYLKALEKGVLPPERIETLASEINTLSQTFKEPSSLSSRFLSRFTSGDFLSKGQVVSSLIQVFDQFRDQIKGMKEKHEELASLESKILSAESFLKKHAETFSKGEKNLSLTEIEKALEAKTSFALKNPLFSELSIDRDKKEISLKWREGVSSSRKENPLFEQLVMNELAKLTRKTSEQIFQEETEVRVPLTSLPNASSYLAINLEKVAEKQLESVKETLKISWRPKHPDLEEIQIVDSTSYQNLPAHEKAICLVLYAPLKDSSTLFPGLKNQSLYVVAKGMERIFKNYEENPNSELAETFTNDFKMLGQILHQLGYFGYPGNLQTEAFELSHDYIFEKTDFSGPLLKGTRENLLTPGSKKWALLEFSDLEQRVVTENKIETQIHEDLLKSLDEYRAAKVSLSPSSRFDVPEPTKNVFLSNLALSARKFFRGDDRKIIRWGLDLSGGKTVQIELRDQNNKVVKGDLELKQGMNELYNRVNKMGVSEVSIRKLGNQIVLDFPGSQALSAAELIKSSTMRFHVVNETFSSSNDLLRESVNRFLQEVWNEALVTNKKDAEAIHQIAYTHLHGDRHESNCIRSDAAEHLWNQGLRLADFESDSPSSELSENLSRIALYRGESFKDWHGHTHPLLIIFHNYALEGGNLENIHSQYDPSKGNYLSFDVKGPFKDLRGNKVDPRGDLFSWTSRYSKESLQGTPLENITKGRGFRMAVLLNDTVINAPTLDSPLQNSAMISGSFSQREVNQLATDLKAGSLTFTPHILSEKNVSPELGNADRTKGIVATFVALLFVIIAMVAYYRFAGVVASVAVIFNLLVLWATLQNLGATLTLAGIAGIILTVGMAVDANVLVFERIKEEFALTKNIAASIQAGYKKAFSAIVDSNVTTIIAALILLNFDAGPIKSFAVNLIIGIASSMFTALFMTRFYFTGWAEKEKNQKLSMSNLLQNTSFDFLKKAKIAFSISLLITVFGGYFALSQKGSILGMDFTGGYSLNLELNQKTKAEDLEKALQKAGMETRDFQIRELDGTNVRLLLGTTMELQGKPFYGLPLELEKEKAQYGFEKNPRIRWIVSALSSSEIYLPEETLSKLDTNWTSMSGQMSESMRNNAMVGLFISFLCIFIYLAFRFEYKFASAALICLFHDVFITLGVIGLLHKMGVAVQIDLNTVAALMTIIGYSLNDTIIVFDRIREEMHFMKKRSLTSIINHSLNVTLSRTTITSGTTLLVLIALVVLGGPSIFSFSLVMTIGVLFGTLSSWFIASPLMIYFHKKEMKKELEA